MELRDIEYFEEIAEQRHLGRAAERLKLSQPALSKSLRRLEEAMQVKLFDRNARGLELTAEGSLLLARARDLRLSLRNVAREVADLSEGRAGHLRIGVGPAIPTRLISDALTKLSIDAPRVAVHVTISDADEIVPALRKGELDLNINLMHVSPPEGLCYVRLYEEEYVVCASKRHPLSRQPDVRLAELSNARWALTESVLPTQQKLRLVFEEQGLPRPQVALESRSLSLRLQAVVASDLLAYASRRGIEQAVAEGYALAVLPVRELAWRRPVGAVHRDEPYLHSAARRFIDILQACSSELRPGVNSAGRV
ncbi:MAG: LysR family transcriptional regulator [Xanthobacteraceae bacterium]|nr:LysR family transcriptional regulator [Xanthobacteraceae bacterium]